MTSFCDMVVLMLCFFVLLLSFAKTDPATFDSALGSVRQALGGPTARVEARSVAPSPLAENSPPRSRAEDARLLHEQQERTTLARFHQYLDARGLSAQVEVSASPRGIVLRTRDRVLFESA